MVRLIAIAGGIGSGKSVVSRILRAMGKKVYDCDTEARRLMDNDENIKCRIEECIAPEVILADRSIDRRRLAAIVFADKKMLDTLNGIVHSAVRDDISRWKAANEKYGTLWVESAIIYESGIDAMVDEVWDVTAPVELRIKRVMSRNSMSREEVMRRIDAQSAVSHQPHPCLRTIVNDEVTPLLPQIQQLIASSALPA